MAGFYSNENFPMQALMELRRLGHEVVTSIDAGKANRAVPDPEVPAFAEADARILLTNNRLHFLRPIRTEAEITLESYRLSESTSRLRLSRT